MSADNESSVVSAAASADRESTGAGMGMPEALSGGLGVSSPAAPPYVPTTTAVRRAYLMRSRRPPRIDAAELGGEFDRWLAEVKAEALRGPADELKDRLARLGHCMTSNQRQGYSRAIDLLYARADEILRTP